MLVNLAYCCIGSIKERGQWLFRKDEDPKEQINDELLIVYEGCVELYLDMDAGIEFPIENLGVGSIINQNNFLVYRQH